MLSSWWVGRGCHVVPPRNDRWSFVGWDEPCWLRAQILNQVQDDRWVGHVFSPFICWLRREVIGGLVVVVGLKVGNCCL